MGRQSLRGDRLPQWYPIAFGRSPRGKSTPPCQGALKKWESLFSPPTPSTGGPADARLRRFSGPAAGYVRRNHRMYSGVARTTSPCSVVVVVYVSRGGALCPSGRLPNASRSSRSFRFSRLCLGVGVPSGGSAAPVYREHPLGLYVLLPSSNASAPSLDPGKDVESSVEKWEFKRHAPPKLFQLDWGCTGCRLVQASIHMYGRERRRCGAYGLGFARLGQVRRSHVWTNVPLL